MFHGDDSKNYTEVGAMWPLKKGNGFSILIKAGISVATMKDANSLCAFEIEDKDDDDAGRR
jgi:hypothetical protein